MSFLFVYEYYSIEKEEIFCVFSMLPLRLAVVPVSYSFFKSLFTPHSPQPSFRNSSSFFIHNLRRTNFILKFDLR